MSTMNITNAMTHSPDISDQLAASNRSYKDGNGWSKSADQTLTTDQWNCSNSFTIMRIYWATEVYPTV